MANPISSEVLVESPQHDLIMALCPLAHVRRILEAYRRDGELERPPGLTLQPQSATNRPLQEFEP